MFPRFIQVVLKEPENSPDFFKKQEGSPVVYYFVSFDRFGLIKFLSLKGSNLKANHECAR